MTETKTYTREDLEAMTPEEVNNVLMKMCKIEGTGVVKRADGTIKYDNLEFKGTYGEEES